MNISYKPGLWSANHTVGIKDNKSLFNWATEIPYRSYINSDQDTATLKPIRQRESLLQKRQNSELLHSLITESEPSYFQWCIFVVKMWGVQGCGKKKNERLGNQNKQLPIVL